MIGQALLVSMASLAELAGEGLDEETIINNRLRIDERALKRLYKQCMALREPVYGSSGIDTPGTLHSQLDLAFTNLLAFIHRNQLHRRAIEREGEKYAAHQETYAATITEITAEIAALRERLLGAQAHVTHKQMYNEMAANINGYVARSSQRIACDGLLEEIAELERHGQVFDETWQDRQRQFGEIVVQMEAMRSQMTVKQEEEKADEDRGEQQQEKMDEDVTA